MRILLALLVLPGLFIRATVPTGFMPVASGGTALTMAMCPGHASQPEVIEPGPAPADDGQPQQKHHQAPCVFAATAGGAAPMFIAAAVDLPMLAAGDFPAAHRRARRTPDNQSPRTPGTAGVRLTDVIARFVRP